jgi:amidophosphoribosyltransferase
VVDFDTSCFSGRYLTGNVTDAYLSRLESERSDSAKMSRANDIDRDDDTDAAVVG